MTQLNAVLWNGYNLEEVIQFTGKHHKFNDWFPTWEDYEKYVKDHDRIFKLFSPTGISVDMKPGTWIVKLPNGYNVPVENCWEKKKEEIRNFTTEDTWCSSGCWDDGNF